MAAASQNPVVDFLAGLPDDPRTYTFKQFKELVDAAVERGELTREQGDALLSGDLQQIYDAIEAAGGTEGEAVRAFWTVI